MNKILFVCGRNRLRSPTAEAVFDGRNGREVASAGLNHDSPIPLSIELIRWADIIFVMEKAHRARLSQFKPHLKNKRVLCLDIPDNYEYMACDLIQLLEDRVGRLLGSYRSHRAQE